MKLPLHNIIFNTVENIMYHDVWFQLLQAVTIHHQSLTELNELFPSDEYIALNAIESEINEKISN